MPSNRSGSGRAALGARLRGLRAREGMSGIGLAARLGWGQSRVSRIETGRQIPTEEDIRAWGDATRLDAGTVDDLLDQLRTLRTEHIAWRRDVGGDPGRPDKPRSTVHLATEATLIRNFEACVVPGLLQTADYARVRLVEDVEFHGAPGDDLKSALLLRIQRQQVLYDSTKRFRFVVTESVLRMLLCPVEVMRGQLDRLAALIGMSNVELGIIPTGIRLSLAPLHGFVMFDDAVVVETWAEKQLLQAAADVMRFSRIFDQLHDAARYGDDARELIGSALGQLCSRA